MKLRICKCSNLWGYPHFRTKSCKETPQEYQKKITRLYKVKLQREKEQRFRLKHEYKEVAKQAQMCYNQEQMGRLDSGLTAREGLRT